MGFESVQVSYKHSSYQEYEEYFLDGVDIVIDVNPDRFPETHLQLLTANDFIDHITERYDLDRVLDVLATVGNQMNDDDHVIVFDRDFPEDKREGISSYLLTFLNQVESHPIVGIN